VVAPAARRVAAATGARCTLVLPHEAARAALPALPAGHPGLAAPDGLVVQVGGLARALADADVAIASTGTVTLECAWFAVPTVALYKTSRSTYEIGRRIVRVPHLAMPNLLAGREVMPEFLQDDATPETLSAAVLGLLESPSAMAAAQAALREVRGQLGPPGAAGRAAEAILAD
jgi:lipid-A-disaccharide synthase